MKYYSIRNIKNKKTEKQTYNSKNDLIQTIWVMGQLSINAVFIHLFNWKTISTSWIYNINTTSIVLNFQYQMERKKKGRAGLSLSFSGENKALT